MIYRYITASVMKRIDAKATSSFGIPALILMENAGRSTAEEAWKILSKTKSKKVAIFCGYGNNGGDGFVAARHLINKGANIDVYLVGKSRSLKQDAKTNFIILKNLAKRGIKKISRTGQIPKAVAKIEKCDLIIDAVFGIGLKGKLDNFYDSLFESLNKCKIPVLAADIPSGLDADKGIALGNAIKAIKTVTFGLPKKGFKNKQAKKYLGKVVVADISLPKDLLI